MFRTKYAILFLCLYFKNFKEPLIYLTSNIYIKNHMLIIKLYHTDSVYIFYKFCILNSAGMHASNTSAYLLCGIVHWSQVINLICYNCLDTDNRISRQSADCTFFRWMLNSNFSREGAFQRSSSNVISEEAIVYVFISRQTHCSLVY